MLGVRASPSGRYVLVLLRAAPSEIWTVRFRVYVRIFVLLVALLHRTCSVLEPEHPGAAHRV